MAFFTSSSYMTQCSFNCEDEEEDISSPEKAEDEKAYEAPSEPSPAASVLAKKQEIIDSSPSFAAAVEQTAAAKEALNAAAKPNSPINKAKKAKVKAEQDRIDAEQALKDSEQKIDDAEQASEKASDNIDDLNEKRENNNDRIKELESDPNNVEAMAEAAELRAENENIAKELIKQKKIKSQNDTIIKTEKAKESDLEKKIDKAKDAEDKAKDKLENEQDKVDDLEEAYEEAKENEKNTLDDLADEYPEKYGKLKDEMDAAEEKAEDDAEQAKKAEIQAAKDLKIKKMKEAAEKAIKDKKQLIADYEQSLKELDDPVAINAVQEQIYLEKKKLKALTFPTPESTLEAIASKTLPASHNEAYLKWDSPDYQIPGKMEEIISQHMQPKMKFAYMGEFPSILDPLDWMVKSMDKPKVDIESVEQIRNNVKRNYPVKYNYGDLSITFWDDMDHKTVTTLYKYFSKKVWDHKAIPLHGTFMLRDSIVIPSFNIYELATNADKHLKYTFENAVLSSFDFDNSEDESDDGIHTIQAVFKIERFEVIEGPSPRTLNSGNAPSWM